MALDSADRRALVRELAKNPGGVEITCAGRSMEPTIELGDRVRVVSVSRPRVGDVVLFESADGQDLILHRVIAALPGIPWFLHDGDGETFGGPALAHRRQLVGRALVPRRLPRLQRALRTFCSRRGLL